jgi:tRNA nucleotidyltransferase (CCA-adding enzyme)
MRIEIPSGAKFIIDQLYKNGYEAFVVGGCVRDSLMGKEPKDWDITTSASPYDVKEIFSRTVDTGIKHGTVTVLVDKVGYEVTTYRIDGEYKDSRHPEEVIFTQDLKEDLRRRDFTINAMAYNDTVGVVDEYNGMNDLKNRIIRCVGVPSERFEEDALRILRAIRFSAQLGFSIDSDTKDAMRKYAHTLDKISAERIKVEMDKTLMSNNPKKIYDAYELGITKIYLEEFDNMIGVLQENPNHMYDVGQHTLCAIEKLSNILKDDNLTKYSGELYSEKEKLALMWTILLHDIGKPSCKFFDEKGVAHFHNHELVGVDMAAKIFNRLKFDNYTADLAKKLIRWHDYRFVNKHISIRKSMNKIGVDIFEYLFLIKRADTLAQNITTIEQKLKDLDFSYNIFKDICDKSQCVSLKDLAIDGRDLIELGIKPGRKIGEYLKQLLEIVIEDPSLNDKKILIDKLKELK